MHAQGIARACQAWYIGKARHSIFDIHALRHSVSTDVGVDQGCPLGAFMFATTMRDPADRVLRSAKSLDANAAFYMYLNDCYILAAPRVVDRIMDFCC